MAHLRPPPVWRRPLQGRAPLPRLSWGSFTPHLAHDPRHFSTPSSSPDPQGSLLRRVGQPNLSATDGVPGGCRQVGGSSLSISQLHPGPPCGFTEMSSRKTPSTCQVNSKYTMHISFSPTSSKRSWTCRCVFSHLPRSSRSRIHNAAKHN